MLPSKFVSIFTHRYLTLSVGYSLLPPGMDAGGCYCCQCSTLKLLKLISRVAFSFLKMLRTRLSNLTKSSYDRHCSETLTSVEGCNFSCRPIFSTIYDSVQCQVCQPFFLQLTYKFSERLDVSCSKRPWRLEWQKENIQHVFQECKKSNLKGNFEQYILDKLAVLLQSCCRNVAGV